MKRVAAVAVALLTLAACGHDDNAPSQRRPKRPGTNVRVVTDWTDSGGNRSEREVIINGHHCIESIGYTNYGSGLSCDWSEQ